MTMLTRITRFGLACALLMGPALAQEAEKPGPAEPAKPKSSKNAPKKKAEEKKEAAAGSEQKESKPVSVNAEGDEVKVLKPQDVAAELLRLKSKADIKAEVTVVPNHGRKVVVKGVVRNGKLIERFVGRRFWPQKNVDHPQSGVRLWWVNNTAGWIFLRYSKVKSIALTGILTAEEKRKIMEALKAEGEKEAQAKKADQEAKLDEQLKKMSPTELEAYLLRQYPADKGWNHERLRQLKRKQIIENQPLSREESVFVSYFPKLIKARLRELKKAKKSVEFEPGSANKKPDEAPAPPVEDDG
jgi:hypothetical protein